MIKSISLELTPKEWAALVNLVGWNSQPGRIPEEYELEYNSIIDKVDAIQDRLGGKKIRAA